MSFEFNLPLQALRESFVRATSRYIDERAARSRGVAFRHKATPSGVGLAVIERAPA
jgi:hypothetical protein